MTTQYIGEEDFKWFLGIAEDVEDELKLGRVKVRIFNEHDDVPTSDLPWAQVMLPTTSGSVEGIGDTPQLVVGSRVFGFFIDGVEKQFPMIIGTIPIIPDMKDDKHSISFLARGKQSIDKKKIHPIEPDSAYHAEYPKNRVIQTRSGHVIELDDTPDNERIHIFHKAGAYIEIDKDGRIVIKSPSDTMDVVGGVKNIAVKGNCNIDVGENFNLNAKGDISIVGQKNVSILAGRRATVKGALGTTIGSGTDVTVSSPGGLHTTSGGIRSVGRLTAGNGINAYITDGSGKYFCFRDGILVEVK